jgi:hypothetical protein
MKRVSVLVPDEKAQHIADEIEGWVLEYEGFEVTIEHEHEFDKDCDQDHWSEKEREFVPKDHADWKTCGVRMCECGQID